MRRSGPPKRNKQLRAKRGLARGAPLRRTKTVRSRAERRAGKTRGEIDAELAVFRKLVLSRSPSMCEARTPACTGGPPSHAHHRKLRKQGGSNDPHLNGLACCAPCHTWIHAHPAAAYDAGWLTRSSDVELPWRP